MGWNSWNHFGCNVNEGLIREMADAMVSSGMRDAGYLYLNIDDCWHGERDANGYIQPDPQRFPNGMKTLADYVHARGLKLGIYSDAGSKTCAGRPGSKGYEQQDAERYAAWGIDYLKYDWCYTEGQTTREAYSLMRDKLAATGHPIVFSLCEWGSTQPWTWGAEVGNLWRTTGDIIDCWDCPSDWGGMGVVHILDQNASLAAFAGPGHWNDPDMLEVGNGGLTETESRAHFSLWCILAAPLIAGNDLRTMPDSIREILTNREVIAVDQDPAGIQGARVRDDGEGEVWSKPLGRGGQAKAVALLNRGATPATITVRWEEIGLAPGEATVRDLWDHADRGTFRGTYSAEVPPHGVVLVRIQGTHAPPMAPGRYSLSDLNDLMASNGFGPMERNTSNGESAGGDGRPIQLAGVVYPKGIGCHAPAEIRYRLNGRNARFTARVGLDDEVGRNGSVTFQVWGDEALLFNSGLMTYSAVPRPVDVELAGKQELRLVVTDGGDNIHFDHADWADAQLILGTPDDSSLFIPAVLASQGAAGSHYTSELTLVNRSPAPLSLELTYVASAGGGSGKARLTLEPGRQQILPDTITFLKNRGLPLPESGNRLGTLRLSWPYPGTASDLAAQVRTTTPVPLGQAGLAYAGLPATHLLEGTSYICGLRQNGDDRSNVAFQHGGAPDSGHLRLRATLFSSELAAPHVFPDLLLAPGEFLQWNSVLNSHDLAVASGYLRVEKIEGKGPYYAYGVINDQLTSDGSFVPAQAAVPDAVPLLLLPALVETRDYLSELVLTNWSALAKTLRLEWQCAALAVPGNRAVLEITLSAGEQRLVPDFVEYLRRRGIQGIPASGDTLVGSLLARCLDWDGAGIFLGARISTRNGTGHFGTFAPALSLVEASFDSTWIFGLQQNSQNRTNLALVNTGAIEGSDDHFSIELFHGETGQSLKTVEGISLGSGEWRQWNSILLEHTPGIPHAYARIRRIGGASPFVVYAVINDGEYPGLRSGDGAYIQSTP
jgi:alpha-galactosidase